MDFQTLLFVYKNLCIFFCISIKTLSSPILYGTTKNTIYQQLQVRKKHLPRSQEQNIYYTLNDGMYLHLNTVPHAFV